MTAELQQENKTEVSRWWLYINIAIGILVLLILGCGVGFYAAKVQQMTQAIKQIQAQMMKIERAYTLDTVMLRELKKTVNDQNFRLQQQQQSLQDITLFTQQRQWRLDEIRYLINLANNSLLFLHDIKTSQQLLRQVQIKVVALHDPTLNTLRQAVSDDIKVLATVTLQDTTQLFLKITVLSQSIDAMPLLGSGFVKEVTLFADSAPPGNTWQARLKHTLLELQHIVIIRKTTDTLLPLIAQEQGEYINQYLQMQLGQAQWAVLHHDNAIYHSSLKQVTDWVNRYFVALNPNTQDVLSAVSALQEIEVSFPNVTLQKTMHAIDSVLSNS